MKNKPNPKVLIYEDANLKYPEEPPFSSSEIYPEFKRTDHHITLSRNEVYKVVRKTLADLGLDKENYGTEQWNPLKKYIPDKGNVLIKPNLVHHMTYHISDQEVVLTHGSLIRVIIDYAFLACGSQGRITIGDSPMMSGDFEKMVDDIGLNKIVEYYKKYFNFTIMLEDFRLTKGVYSATGYLDKVITVDANNHTNIHLDNSFHKVFESNFEVTDASTPTKTYTIPNSILNADCIINIPKLKTHKIAGITCCLKAMIGANSEKNQILPHYRRGSSNLGGDEFKKENILMKLKRFSLVKLKKGPKILFDISHILFSYYRKITLKTGFGRDLYGSMLEHGAWPGNNTLWRSILDLNRCVMFGTIEGKVSDQKQRTIFSLVDGIVAGEGQGPFNPNKKRVGLLIAGDNSLANDLVSCRLMGFDWQKMNTFNKIMKNSWFTTEPDKFCENIDLIIHSNSFSSHLLGKMFNNNNPLFEFDPPVGWDDIKIKSE